MKGMIVKCVVFLTILGILFMFVGCSSEPEIVLDAECVESAISLVPDKIEMYELFVHGKWYNGVPFEWNDGEMLGEEQQVFFVEDKDGLWYPEGETEYYTYSGEGLEFDVKFVLKMNDLREGSKRNFDVVEKEVLRCEN